MKVRFCSSGIWLLCGILPAARRHSRSEWTEQNLLTLQSQAKQGFNWKSILAYWKQKPLNCSYKRFNDSPIHTYVVQECCWIAHSVVKVVMNGFCIIMFVCCLHCVQDGVTDSKVSGNESIFFLWYDDWRIRMSKIVMECWLKNAKIVIEPGRFLSLMNVTSRNSSSFHANECVFSHKEQQKV